MMLRHDRKAGFSLLELMIALGLLGTLLAVAWSLLGTFRDAEMRGWKLSFRTQTIRSARNWLESDLQHLILDVPPKTISDGMLSRLPSVSNSAAFQGTEMGFSATISPSLDPIPFLGNLMSDTIESQPGTPSDNLYLGGSLGDDTMPASHWSADSVEIEYELVAMDYDPAKLPVMSDGLLDQTQYALVRREQLNFGFSATPELPSERVLTSQDLYQQDGVERAAYANPMSETRLEALIRPQFRYFDGVNWSKQWNSSQRGGLPRAIAFGFDFPAAKDLVHPSDKATRARGDNERTDSSAFNEPLLSPADLSQDATSELAAGDKQGMMLSSTSEVQLVIYVGGSGGRPTPATNASGAGSIWRGTSR